MNISIRGEEHINWDIVGPIYKDQCEALKNLVEELKELIFKMDKELNPPSTEMVELDQSTELESLLDQKHDDEYHSLKDEGLINHKGE